MDEYRHPGFRPGARIKGVFGDPQARVIRLERRKKKQSVDIVEQFAGVTTTRRFDKFGIYLVAGCGYIWKWRFAGFSARGVRR